MGISGFERQRISDLQLKRERRKAAYVDVTSQSHNCTICGWGCAAAIGLYSHMRTHKHWLLIRQLDGRFQQVKRYSSPGRDISELRGVTLHHHHHHNL